MMLQERFVKLAFACIITIAAILVLFTLLQPLLPYRALHGDERYYIGRALQNIEFYLGARPAKAVWFSSGNHPFSAETIIGLFILLQGEFREAPKNPWKTLIDKDLLVAARRSALFIGLLGLGVCMFLAIYLNPWLTLVPLLYLLSSPGFVDFSLRCMLDIYLASFTTISLVFMVLYLVTKSCKHLFMSGLFTGLAFGSKTGWDPLIMFLIHAIIIFTVEKTFRSFVKRLMTFTATLLISFCITSFVIVLRLEEHINSVLRHHVKRISLSHMFSDQALANINMEEMAKGFNIFMYQHPICVLVTSIMMIMFLSFLVTSSFKQGFSLNMIIKKIEGDDLLRSTFFVTLFTALTLILTSITFEYGRNYARLSLYESLTTILILATLLKSLRKTSTKILLLLFTYVFLTVAFYSYYCNIFGNCYSKEPLFFKTKCALIPTWSWLKGAAPLAYLIPWLKALILIPWSGLLLLASTLAFLTLVLAMGTTLVFREIRSMLSEITIFRNMQKVLYNILGQINIKSKPTFHHKLLGTSKQETEKILVHAQESRKEIASHLEKLNLGNLAVMLLGEIESVPSDKTLIKAINKLIKTYERHKGLKGLTLREALLSIAKEYDLNINEIIKLIRYIEDHIYGDKPLAPEAREIMKRLLVKLKEKEQAK